MPELPEVETTLKGITPHLHEQTIKQFIVRNPNLRWPVSDSVKDLAGLKIESLWRRGKYIIMEIGKSHLLWHLGMSGSMTILPSGSRQKKHDHIEMQLETGQSLIYHDPRRFGSLLITDEDPLQHPLLARLGVEPLTDDFDSDFLFRTSRKRQTPIKSFIMDSHRVVGVGNIYASEALFAAGISPTCVSGTLSRKRLVILVDQIKRILKEAIQQGGSTLRDFTQADGQPGYFAQSLNVYGNQAQCPTCNTSIKRITQNQRSSFYCPKCQT
jgi:formamidopyrimidine-DNA glycosylase